MTPPPKTGKRGDSLKGASGSTRRMVRPAAPMRPNEVPAGTEEVTHRISYFYSLTLVNFRFARP